MDPPQPRKKREAVLKKRDKGHVYSARHVRTTIFKNPEPTKKMSQGS
jgi:hypothetical protein